MGQPIIIRDVGPSGGTPAPSSLTSLPDAREHAMRSVHGGTDDGCGVVSRVSVEALGEFVRVKPFPFATASLFLIFSAIGGVAQGDTAATDASVSTQGLSALHVRLRMPGELEIARASVELSEEGLLVRQAGQGADAWEMLENFTEGELWLIDRSRKVAYELSGEARLGPSAGPEPASSAVPSMAGGSATAAFLGSEPCARTGTVSVRPGTWRNRAVSVHDCLPDAEGVFAVELVDGEFDIVSYRRSSDGRVDELRDLRARTFALSRFRPSTDMRPVDEAEFFGGAPEIDRYVEPEERRSPVADDPEAVR